MYIKSIKATNFLHKKQEFSEQKHIISRNIAMENKMLD